MSSTSAQTVNEETSGFTQTSRWYYWFAVAGLIVCSLGWCLISDQFDPLRETGPVASTSRPFALFFALIFLGCVAYLVAVWRAVVQPQEFRLKDILGVAILCRVLLIPSLPIQEIDLYRYLWDGYVVNQGISPYRYAPNQIKQAISEQASEFPRLPTLDNFQQPESDAEQLANPEVAALVAMCNQRPEVHRILDAVHFSELPTVYPPVSQAVFAISVFSTPRHVSRYVRLVVLKSWLILFDLATLLGILAILKQLAIPRSWAIVYAWSPLVLKEYANSGHLDTITVAFSVWTLVMLIRAVAGFEQSRTDKNVPVSRGPMVALILSAILFACSIAGKLYPVLLCPVLGLFLLKRLGIRRAGLWATTVVLATFLFLSPWVFSDYGQRSTVELANQQTDSASGLQAFVTRWQINDVAFSLIHENLLADSLRNSTTPWYVVAPNSWRESCIGRLSKSTESDSSKRRACFLVARGITLIIWLLIVAVLLKTLWRDPTAKQLVHQTFLVLAWFWLLAPTQNPWYWTWALPFILPSHRKAWLGMSCVLFAYYVRFPLLYFEVEAIVPGTTLSGWELFSDVVVWIEFVPLMLWVLFYNSTNENSR